VDDKKKVTLNEHEMTQEDFDRQKEKLEKKPGVKVVKISEDNFRSRIKG
jgi:hypothetical protein